MIIFKMKRDKLLYGVFVFVLLFVLGGMFFFLKDETGGEENQKLEIAGELEVKKDESGKEKMQKPEFIIDESKEYRAVLETSAGPITILLNANKTPITVNNFVYLSKSGFYNGTVFHRVINGFMIQGGDPRGDGTGGPGYKFDDEPFEGEYKRGVVAMANSGPNTNGSQFFIMHQDYPLPPNYVIFGNVVEGISVVDAISSAEVVKGLGGEMSKPVDPVVIERVEIIESEASN